MAVKLFTRPTSLNGKLATVPEYGSMSRQANSSVEPTRSTEAAKNVTDAYTKDEKSPLSHRIGHSKPGITFAAQDRLPKLPIPELDSSLKKYLSALRPLQSAKEHRDTEAAVQEFARSDGAKLQDKLKEYAKGRANYIEQFCEFTTSCHSTVGAYKAQGTTHTSTSTIQSCSISIHSSYLKMTRLPRGTIK
jgi:carnitine O-acetyltransferase